MCIYVFSSAAEILSIFFSQLVEISPLCCTSVEMTLILIYYKPYLVTSTNAERSNPFIFDLDFPHFPPSHHRYRR